jgi:hypothetical protein
MLRLLPSIKNVRSFYYFYKFMSSAGVYETNLSTLVIYVAL